MLLGIFVGLPDDSAGWLFYVLEARSTYISLDAVFDEDFTSPISMPDPPSREQYNSGTQRDIQI